MATKLKAKAQIYACSSREQAQKDISMIGMLQREHGRISGELNDRISALTEAEAPRLKELQDRIGMLQAGVQTWCEANREQICGKGKTANLITGEVSWRQRPPSVSIRGVDTVLDTLLRMGLGRFVRVKNEPNKEAMLNEPEAVRGIAGISIVTGVEDFIVVPFEATAEVQ